MYKIKDIEFHNELFYETLIFGFSNYLLNLHINQILE